MQPIGVGVSPVFALIVLVLLGVFGLRFVFPLVQRLTEAIAKRIEGGTSSSDTASQEQIRALEDSVRTLEAQVGELEEQQKFLEKLLEDRPPASLPPSPRREPGGDVAG
jgi:hypothetical protein